ncbi:Arf-GAP with coiled-coil, ANK repeat and PH domain-containing protein 2 [Mortierella polycephala]|uniref:Arf-GAP with coiled-coil, ANK repeat and PH domain-containing protein 2 n=1 Tax=Mortierella polycephala TaxID=41804 RepID=A0A9P6U290_9FUNG|nr:Arf-GAP with coiled-coil, ANK repeat and PH domain-containing protein 2 [Mortierella polycephala]
MNVLELKACKEDTPNFRKQVNEHEDAVVALETTVKSLLKLSKASVELAEEYSARQLQMAEEMMTVAQSQRGHDFVVTQSVEAFSRAIQDLERNRSMMNTQITQMFIEPMVNFLNHEVLPVREARKSFQKASDDVDLALHRYMSKRTRDQSIPEASKDVADARKKFHIEYVDYCIKLNELQAKEKFEFTEHIVTYMYTLSSFYHRGFDVLSSVEPSMSTITQNIQGTRIRFNEEKPIVKALRDETLNVGNEIYYPLRPFGGSADNLRQDATTKSGYLYKKGHQRVMPTWSRRYFEIQGELLTYNTRGQSAKSDSDACMVINLRVCTVKKIENGDRPHLFEVISPMRVHVLQAENIEDMKEWVCCLQNAITAAHNSDQAPEVRGFGSSSERMEPLFTQHGSPNLNGNTDQDKQLLLQVRKIPGNEVCADCKSLSPMWASVNHGTVLCIECSGIHRSLGVHVSKVRSLNLDKWETEAVGVMLKLGNEKTNKIFEAKILSGAEERGVSVNSDRAERERFIIAKYIRKEFITSEDSQKEFLTRSVHEAFWEAMDVSDYCEALRCLALGANIDHRKEEHGSMSPLHRAIIRRDDIAVEFLFQWFCDINAIDREGWCALHHAVANDNSRALTQLIKKHAKYDIRNKTHQTALDLAKTLEKSEALIVLQIYQFEHQQIEQTRPSSAQSGNMSNSTLYQPCGPSSTSSLPGSTSSSASLSELSGFASADTLSLVTTANGSLPPLQHYAAPISNTDLSTSASTSTLASSVASTVTPTVVSTVTNKVKEGKPNLSSRNSTGNVTMAAAVKTAVGATPTRFSVADSRSLAEAMTAGDNPWAEEFETAKANILKGAKDLQEGMSNIATTGIKEEED